MSVQVVSSSNVSAWNRPSGQYQAPFQGQSRGSRRVWKRGEIAYLKPEDAFDADEHNTLIKPRPGCRHGYLPPKATGHPVIILSSPTERSTHVLVTPVSAYSSGADNNFLPPWKQHAHRFKDPRDFRSFNGCERVSDAYPYLFLEGDKSMPKTQASWTWIQSFWAVPLTVISRFTKTKELLRLREDSIDDLLSHMEAKCKRWKAGISELEAHERRANGVQDTSPAALSSWRAPRPRPASISTQSGYARPPPSAGTSSPPKATSPPNAFSYASVASGASTGTRQASANSYQAVTSIGQQQQQQEEQQQQQKEQQQQQQQQQKQFPKKSNKRKIFNKKCAGWGNSASYRLV